MKKSGQRTVPNTYINAKHLGGADDTFKAHNNGELMNLLNVKTHSYEYDLVSRTNILHDH